MRTAILLTLLSLGLLGPTASLGAPETEAFVVIVHPESEMISINRAELSKIFLRRLHSWDNGDFAKPVDQRPESPVRRQFCLQVHERSVVNVEVYWKRMIFSGRAVPPAEVASDAEVIEFVRKTPGAVGYVSAATELEVVKRLRLHE